MTSYDSLQPPHCASEVSFSSLSIFTLCANRSLIRLQNYTERVLCSIEYRVSSFNWISRKHRIHPFLILETRDSNCSNPHAEPVTRWCSGRALGSWSRGRGFDSDRGIIRATTLGKLFTPNVPLFTKQYNLVPCEGLRAKSAVLLAAA